MIGLKKKRNKLKDKNFIDNEQFTKAVNDWVQENKEHGKNRKMWTPMPEVIGVYIMKLVENYALKNSWRNYTYLEDMKSEAIMTCVRYAHNFDITKSENAFAYFTQLTFNAFYGIKLDEVKQVDIKTKTISENSIYNYDNINLHDEETE